MAGPSFGSALLSGAGAAPSEPAPAAEDSLLVPSQDLIDALKTGDAAQVSAALRAAITIVNDEDATAAPLAGGE